MTLIELIDAAPIQNILGTLAFHIDKVIFVGSYKETTFNTLFKPRFQTLFETKALQGIPIEYVQIIKNDFSDIYAKLQKIVDENDDCYFDVSGGEDLTLTVAGAIFVNNPDVSVYQINPVTSSAQIYQTEITQDGLTNISKNRMKISIENTVEENIILHGGAIVYDTEKSGCTHRWQFSLPFLNDLNKMWKICCSGPGDNKKTDISWPKEWNAVTTTLCAIEALNMCGEVPNELVVDVSAAQRLMSKRGGYAVTDSYLQAFLKAGLITLGAQHTAQTLHIIYKNEQVRLCLTKAGTILELKTYLACESLIPEKFTDCMTGVTIDWDGVIHDEADAAHYYKMDLMSRLANIEDTSNEIDVILMKGVIPYFISCKNGRFTSDEMYKLFAVCQRFSKGFGKMFIITTDYDNSNDSYSLEYLQQRADDMDITIIKDVHKMSDEEFAKTLKKKFNA